MVMYSFYTLFVCSNLSIHHSWLVGWLPLIEKNCTEHIQYGKQIFKDIKPYSSQQLKFNDKMSFNECFEVMEQTLNYKPE